MPSCRWKRKRSNSSLRQGCCSGSAHVTYRTIGSAAAATADGEERGTRSSFQSRVLVVAVSPILGNFRESLTPRGPDATLSCSSVVSRTLLCGKSRTGRREVHDSGKSATRSCFVGLDESAPTPSQ